MNKKKIETLLPFTIIQGLEYEGTVSNAIHITRMYPHQTSFVSMYEPGMLEARIPNIHLSKELKALVIRNCYFPKHTEAIKKLIAQDEISFLEPGNKEKQKIKRPAIVICTSTDLEEIPMDIFPDKVGLLKCG